MDNKTKDALKQLQAEMRQLQARLTEPKPEAAPDAEPETVQKDKPGRDAAVSYAIHYGPVAPGSPTLKTGTVAVSTAQLDQVSDEAAAGLGYALSSPQKVGLLRALLSRESETAAALGAATNLSTGSLYHHLRDLIHAGLIRQAGRNRYVLSERGLKALLLTLALAAE